MQFSRLGGAEAEIGTPPPPPLRPPPSARGHSLTAARWQPACRRWQPASPPLAVRVTAATVYHRRDLHCSHRCHAPPPPPSRGRHGGGDRAASAATSSDHLRRHRRRRRTSHRRSRRSRAAGTARRRARDAVAKRRVGTPRLACGGRPSVP